MNLSDWNEKIQNILVLKQKGMALSITCITVFLLMYKLLPTTFWLIDSKLRYFFIADVFLCAVVGVKINISKKWDEYVSFFLLFLSPVISFLCVEMGTANSMDNMQIFVCVLNYLLYLAVYLIIYFFINSIKASIILGSLLFAAVALINSFVREFKGNSIRVSDVFAIKTAVNVAGGYEYVFTEVRVFILLISFAVILIALHLNYKEKRTLNMLIQRLVIIFLCAILFVTVFNQAYIEKKSLKPYTWEIAQSALDHGSLLDFVAGIPYLKVKKPEDYSKTLAEQIEEKGAEHYQVTHDKNENLNKKTPDVIVIMNESLSDLERFDVLQLNESCLTEFKSMKENVIYGNLSVPVFGGLTANTEFEFLTGFSYSFLPAGVMAFQNYVKEGTYNLGQYLKQMGYYTMFMHPYDKSGWNRSNVYPLFGFDESVYMEDFIHQDLVRTEISDSANYKEIIDRYEKAKETNESVFIFNVTMQNHGGYTTNMIEKSINVLAPEGNFPKTEEYLSLIKKSDEAFQELVQYFKDDENPVIICMFGDHLPVIEEEMTQMLINSGDGNEIEKMARKYQTPFLIYANYDIEEKEYENISCNYLQTVLMKVTGLPLNTYQQYLGDLSEKYPVINQFGVKDANGNWYSWEEASKFEEIKEYEIVQYNNLFE